MANHTRRRLKERNGLRTLGRLGLVLAIAFPLYLVVYRPLQLHWGATALERTRTMPGDEIQPRPIFNATRAVTINGRPEAIWPWIVQIGYRRAGWYSALDWLDNGGVASATRIVPELQRLKVGDSIPITARGDPWSFVPEITWRVVALEPNRYLLATSPNGQDSWLWALEPLGEHQTRLVWRMRNANYEWTSPFIFLQLATDLGDFVIVRNILLSIKERVEGRAIGSLAAGTPVVVLWLLAFGAFLVSLVMLVVRRDWLRPLAAVATTCSTTLLLVFRMPPLWLDALAVILVYGLVWWLYRSKSSERVGFEP